MEQLCPNSVPAEVKRHFITPTEGVRVLESPPSGLDFRPEPGTVMLSQA